MLSHPDSNIKIWTEADISFPNEHHNPKMNTVYLSSSTVLAIISITSQIITKGLPAGTPPPRWHTPLCSLHCLTLPQRSSLIPAKTKGAVGQDGQRQCLQNRHEGLQRMSSSSYSYTFSLECVCVCSGMGSCESPTASTGWWDVINNVADCFERNTDHVTVEYKDKLGASVLR